MERASSPQVWCLVLCDRDRRLASEEKRLQRGVGEIGSLRSVR